MSTRSPPTSAWRSDFATRSATTRRASLHRLALLLCAGLLAGCGAVLEPIQQGRALIEGLAAREGWTRAEYGAEGFSFIGYRRFLPGSADLVVYIEGDGAEWVGRRQPADPTPVEPDAFRLALADRGSSRLYLARPCQFLATAELARCDPAYWAGRRHAPEVIAALSQAIDGEKAASGARRVVLHGKSGGGVAAALVAARRRDVAFLMTAAAYLDSAHWTEIHGVTPLHGSLNPADLAAELAAVRQVHLVGGRDRIAPPAVTQRYAARFAEGAPVAVIVLADFDHDCCWRREWPALLAQYRRLP